MRAANQTTAEIVDYCRLLALVVLAAAQLPSHCEPLRAATSPAGWLAANQLVFELRLVSCSRVCLLVFLLMLVFALTLACAGAQAASETRHSTQAGERPIHLALVEQQQAVMPNLRG